MNRRAKAEEIIRNHVLYSMSVAAIPVPVIDIFGVTFIQMDMLKQLSKLYDLDFDENKGKMFLTSLLSSTVASTLSSGLKAVGEKGKLVSWASSIVLNGAITYAIGHLFLSAYEYTCKSLFDMDLEKAGDLFEEAFEKGKEYVENLIKDKD